jgi:hypothetical protein
MAEASRGSVRAPETLTNRAKLETRLNPDEANELLSLRKKVLDDPDDDEEPGAGSSSSLYEESNEKGVNHDPAVVRAYESLFPGPAAATGGRSPRLPDNVREDDLILYVLYRGEREMARIKADASEKIRAKIEEVEREVERSESRVHEAKARKLAEVDRDAERRLRNDPSVVRAYESLLLDRARIEADASAEMRAKLDELERERDGSESRIRQAAMKKLADVDQDAKRKIRDVCAAFGMLPPPST